MSWSVTIGGRTFTNEDVDGRAYADEENGLPAILAAITREADFIKGRGMFSATSVIPRTGIVVFTISGNAYGYFDDIVRIQSIERPDHYMIGTISGRDPRTITVNVHKASGTEEISDWLVASPVSMFGGDVQGGITLPTGAMSAGGSVGTYSAGGRRATMSREDDIVAFGANSGGDLPALKLALMMEGRKIMETDAGSIDKTFYGGTRFAGGLSYNVEEAPYNAGYVRHVLNWEGGHYRKIRMGRVTLLDFLPEPQSDASVHWVTELVQSQSTPGSAPRMALNSVLNEGVWVQPAGGVDWASQPASSSVILKTEYYSGTLYHSAFGKHVDQSWTSS